MSTPGIGDPYWYEWYVGLKYIVEMINPDSRIASVIFQHETYDTVDDVVVEYKDGTEELCYQVKHEISTSKKSNLTFGKLIEQQNGKNLLDSIFSGWENTHKNNKPILFTNRTLGRNKSARIFRGQKYPAYSITDFFELIKKELEDVDDFTSIAISDHNLAQQFEEFCSAIKAEDQNNIVKFIKAFSIYGNQPNLTELESTLVTSIQKSFSCSEGLAKELFEKLVAELRFWTTTRRENERVTIENVYSALSIKEDINESQHRLIPPEPFFNSRKDFCNDVEEKVIRSDKNVIFITGDPGSGKTSTISYIQSTRNLFLLRYHTFRPISPNQHFYNNDAGMYSSENLWGTLLNQLRKVFAGNLAKYQVPVSNKLLTIEAMRQSVLRLLGVYATDYNNNERIYVCIDGIDHAARAKNDVTFLTSLPTPDEIPSGVCFVIVGQPSTMYSTQYPVWITSNDVEKIELPILCISDIEQLINSEIPQLKTNQNELASFIYEKTEGNNLSTVYAIEEIKHLNSIDDIICELNSSGINADVQQYYHHIWNHAKSEILKMGIPVSFPESIIAFPILLMNGRVNLNIISEALKQYKLSKTDWEIALKSLYPLIIPTSRDGEYTLFHNDFRVFLMGIISGHNERYEEIALLLAKYILEVEKDDVLKYISGIPLLECAKRTDLVPNYITPEFIIGALAEGISKQRLDDYLHLSYFSACQNQNLEGLLNTYLSIKTLHQHIRYYEYYEREYVTFDFPETESIDIAEVRALPLNLENLFEYENVLDLCKKLYVSNRSDCITRAFGLYNKWFGDLSPYDFIKLYKEKKEDDKRSQLRTDEIGMLLQKWGETIARLNIAPPSINTPDNELEASAIDLVGESYFNTCIKYGSFNNAITAINQHYIFESVFCDKLEDFLYSGNAHLVKRFLPRVSDNPNKPSSRLLALALLVMCENSDDNICDKDLKTSPQIKHIYEETSFSIILRAFLIGYIERELDDSAIIDDLRICTSLLEDREKPLKQMLEFTNFAGLLGKYYWYESNVTSSEFIDMAFHFLTSEIYRIFDHFKSIKFLLYALLFSPVGEALNTNNEFIDKLVYNLFEVENIGMYYKTFILEYLKRHNKIEIIKDYIIELYGENCSKMSFFENKVEMHNIFKPYGELVCPDLMKKFSSDLKWDVVGYTGNKEYIMQAPSELFELLTSTNPDLWHCQGKRLFIQSSIAKVSANSYYEDINETLEKAAINCGMNDYWELTNWNIEFKLNAELLFCAILELINSAKSSKDLELLWVFNLGINSWYTQEDRLGALSVYEKCLEKGKEINIDFREIVNKTTPQWLNIIDHESAKKDYTIQSNEFEIRRNEEINIIKSEYDTLNKNEIIMHLREIPMLNHERERYELVIKLFESDSSTNNEDVRKLLDSVCNSLDDKDISYHSYDKIISYLFSSLGFNAFWRFLSLFENNLSEYDYQISMRNLQKLISLYFRNDYEKQSWLFDKELSTQELWVTGNRNISIECNYINTNCDKSNAHSLIEVVFDVLIEQVITQNARKVEASLLAIRVLGGTNKEVFELIVKKWSEFSEVQKDSLLFIIPCWFYQKVDISILFELLKNEYYNCNYLYRKYYIHSLLLMLGLTEDVSISYSSDAPCYELPSSGEIGESTFHSLFLHETEIICNSYDYNNGIRRYINTILSPEVYNDDISYQYGDMKIPVRNSKIEQVLYDVDKKGVWNRAPLYLKKALLLSPEDSLIVTDLPNIIYDNNFLSGYKSTDDNKSFLDSDVCDKKNLLEMSKYDLSSEELLLAASLWLPFGNSDEIVYNYTSKMLSIFSFLKDNQIYFAVGNYGLLLNQGGIFETVYNTCSNGGADLFYRTIGPKRFNYGDSQFVPSSIWYSILNCKPSSDSPYIWEDENHITVLKFERLASPSREVQHEQYIRQPVLFRWTGNAGWINKQMKKLGMKLLSTDSIEQFKEPF